MLLCVSSEKASLELGLWPLLCFILLPLLWQLVLLVSILHNMEVVLKNTSVRHEYWTAEDLLLASLLSLIASDHSCLV